MALLRLLLSVLKDLRCLSLVGPVKASSCPKFHRCQIQGWPVTLANQSSFPPGASLSHRVNASVCVFSEERDKHRAVTFEQTQQGLKDPQEVPQQF